MCRVILTSGSATASFFCVGAAVSSSSDLPSSSVISSFGVAPSCGVASSCGNSFDCTSAAATSEFDDGSGSSFPCGGVASSGAFSSSGLTAGFASDFTSPNSFERTARKASKPEMSSGLGGSGRLPFTLGEIGSGVAISGRFLGTDWAPSFEISRFGERSGSCHVTDQ